MSGDLLLKALLANIDLVFELKTLKCSLLFQKDICFS